MEQRTLWRRKAAFWIAGIITGAAIAILIVGLTRIRRERSLSGAVVIANTDPRKQLPVPDVEITAEAGGVTVRARSDSSGFFRLQWREPVWKGEQVTLRFVHAEYQPLEITAPLGDDLYIARMTSSASVKNLQEHGPDVPISNLRIRYAVKTTTTINIGSTTKTFEVVNTANVPCNRRPPCSPDGKWKAATGSISLDTDEGQEFQNARVSCIAGPCPFSRIESDGFSRGGRHIAVSVRAWADTVTFLIEAEVVSTAPTDAIRQGYASIFGRTMSFTLPPTGQGPSIEADIDGTSIVFPLGPDLKLSWASCSMQTTADRTKLYSCELKPGYQFK